MSRRQPAAGTPAYEPKGCPNGAASRRCTPLLPRLFTPDLRTGRESAGAWWQDCERLPYLSPGIPYGPRGRGTLRALLLPPLLPSGTAQGAGARGAGARRAGARGAGARETRQPAARDNPDTFGVLLGKFLPTKFRDFLHQLRAKSAEPEEHREAAGTRVGWGGVETRVPSEDHLQFTGLSSSSPFSFSSLSSPPSTLSATVPQGCIRALPRFVSQLLVPPRPVVSGDTFLVKEALSWLLPKWGSAPISCDLFVFKGPIIALRGQF